jgi:hypothetical protein
MVFVGKTKVFGVMILRCLTWVSFRWNVQPTKTDQEAEKKWAFDL